MNFIMQHYAHMDYNTYYGCKTKDTFCGRSMVMVKLKFVKGKNLYEAASDANETVPNEYENQGTAAIKEVLKPKYKI